MYSKSWRVCLGVGPSDPWIRLWIMIKSERLGDTQIRHDVGGKILWHPCLLGSFGVFYEFHIHAWNMAQGWMDEERFGSIILWSGGTWKSHPGFGFCIINMMLFLLAFLWVLCWFICVSYGCDFIGIYVANMMVIYMFYDSSYVWISSCFYW